MPTTIDNNMGGEAPTDAVHPDDDRWLLANRISTSATFSRAPRLAHLLLYLCEQVVAGHSSQLTEQNIATKVFDRKGKFDPAADTIVRSHMLRLRQKLDTYFKEEGINESLLICIPKGGYVPFFEKAPVKDTPAQPDSQPAVDTAPTQAAAAACMLLSILCVVALSLLIAAHPFWHRGEILDHSVRHQIWKELFQGKSATILVAADSGLAMLHGATLQNSTLSEYLAKDFSKRLNAVEAPRRAEILSLAGRRYTSFVDLEFFDRLTHQPETLSANYSLRYARDISVNDLKTSNAILSGSQDANPWIELFEPQMNFVLRNDLAHGVRAFADRKPLSGEHDLYVCDQFEYGVLAFLPNLNNTGNVLIAEGTSVAGTQAISDFLFADDALNTFLTKIVDKNGSIPHFEILLESINLNGSASRSKVVAYRVH